MNDSIPAPHMGLTLEEEKKIDFFVFEAWLSHYAENVRRGEEDKFKAWLVETARSDSEVTRATAKAVYRWGPRMDISKMP